MIFCTNKKTVITIPLVSSGIDFELPSLHCTSFIDVSVLKLYLNCLSPSHK